MTVLKDSRKDWLGSQLLMATFPTQDTELMIYVELLLRHSSHGNTTDIFRSFLKSLLKVAAFITKRVMNTAHSVNNPFKVKF